MPAGVSRRDFLKSSGKSATAIALPYFVPATVLGRDNSVAASETIRIGVIGTRQSARQLMDQLSAVGRIVAIADCYQARLEQTLAEKKQSWATYGDYRQLLDKEKIDAAFVITPDHGRVLPCIHAVQSGRDVYAEKPLTAYITEGRHAVRARCKASQRIFQVGTQQRTMEMNDYACRLVRSGGTGKVAHCAVPSTILDLGSTRAPSRGAHASAV